MLKGKCEHRDQRLKELAGSLGQHTLVWIQACDYVGM